MIFNILISELAPTFKKRPLEPEIYAAVRTNISISCQPEAAPTPEYEWWKDGLKLGRGKLSSLIRNVVYQIENSIRK